MASMHGPCIHAIILLIGIYQIRVRILPSSTGGEMNHTPFSLKQSTGSTRMTFDQPVGGAGTHLAFDVFEWRNLADSGGKLHSSTC